LGALGVLVIIEHVPARALILKYTPPAVRERDIESLAIERQTAHEALKPGVVCAWPECVDEL
jgi:hypothetical protein